MKTKRFMLSLICAMAMVMNGTTFILAAAPQEKSPQRDVLVQEGTVVVTAQSQGGPAASTVTVSPGMGGDTFVFVSGEMSFDGKTVKGAPYSAQAVTESIQTLADGNRIVHKTTAQVYRDSEGRTRREQVIAAVGPYTSAGEAPQMIFINDPVAGANYILDASNKTARKIETFAKTKDRDMAHADMERAVTATKMRIVEQHAGAMKKRRGGEGDVVFEQRVAPAVVAGGFGPSMERIKIREPKVEALGKQIVEGVEAEGKRTIVTIAAGEIGNEQPINITEETWYSAELQTVVMRRHSDPRFGENTYRLTNINRSEPQRSLFELPSDYTVEEVIPAGMRTKLEMELQRSKKKEEKEQ